MRRRTRLKADHAAWQAGEKSHHLPPSQPALNHHRAGRVNPVYLHHALRQIDPDNANLVHGWSPSVGSQAPTLAHRCRKGAIHPIKPGHEGERDLSLIHISEPTRLLSISYAVFCLKKK